MSITCLQENLSGGIATVLRAVSSRSAMPDIQNVLIESDAGRLRLTATNLEISISTWIGATIEEEAAFSAPAQMIADFVRALPGSPVMLNIQKDPLMLKIECDTFKAQFNGSNPDDFPPIPRIEGGATVSIPAAQFKNAISRVVCAAATEESRPVLTGVKLMLNSDEFVMASADGYRLAVELAQPKNLPEEPIDIIIPARSLEEVRRLIGDYVDIVHFTVPEKGTQALFRIEETELVTQLVQGQYPDYKKLIPTSQATKISVDAEQFKRAVASTSVFARDGNQIIRLITGEKDSEGQTTLEVTARADEIGENRVEIPATIEGPKSKIAFNYRFLQDMLRVIEGETLLLHTDSPSSPGVFRSTQNDNYTHVIMPMFVEW